MRKKLLKLCVLLLTVICVFSMMACSSNKYGSPSGDSSVTEGEGGSSGMIVNDDINRKIVYTVSMTLYVDDVDVGNVLRNRAYELGGHVQQSSENAYNNNSVSYYYVFRIPTEQLDAFVSTATESGTVRNKEVTTVDITTKYVTAQAGLETLFAEKTALLELLENTSSLNDIFSIRNRITEIDTHMKAIQLELNGYDSQLDYSTVTVRMEKSAPPSEKAGFGERIKNIFIGSFKSVGTVFQWLFIAFVAVFPYLLILGALATIVILILVFIRKKKRQKCENYPESKFLHGCNGEENGSRQNKPNEDRSEDRSEDANKE